MSGIREILTLQFGNYANQIGTHWWNIQECGFGYDGKQNVQEIDHDVLYREGVNLNRQTTFTPRLLLVDLDGAQKHLPIEGELYEQSIKRSLIAEQSQSDTEDGPLKKIKAKVEWNEGEVELCEAPAVARNEFQMDLDDPEKNCEEKQYEFANTSETWADFLYARYHPRTVNIIKEYKFAPDEQSLDTFAAGVKCWQGEQFAEDFSEKIRQYVEECDYLQGFQTIFDSFNGFSGLASECLGHLNDEYTKANFVIPVFAPKNILFKNSDEAMSDSIRVINSALTFDALIEHASLFVPLSTEGRVWRQLGAARALRSLNYQAGNLYQTSAILAAFMDTISLRYRLKNAPVSNTLAALCSDVTNYGRKLGAAALALPFSMQHDMDLIDCLDKFEGDLFTQLTPHCQIGNDYVIQSLCLRGIPSDRLKRPISEAAKLQMRMSAYKCNSVSEMLQLYLQCNNHASIAHVTAATAAMPTRIPFPNEMFDPTVGVNGFLSTTTTQRNGAKVEKVESVPTLASVQCCSTLGESLEVLYREAKRVKIAKLHRFAASGLENEDFSTALENLLLFKDNYEDNFEL